MNFKQQLKTFEALSAHLSMEGERRRVAVICAGDVHTRQAVVRALGEGLVEAWFVGDTDQLEGLPELLRYGNYVHYVPAASDEEAAAKAVDLVHEGIAEVMMKGLSNTDSMLRALRN